VMLMTMMMKKKKRTWRTAMRITMMMVMVGYPYLSGKVIRIPTFSGMRL
jgi:hypothetical protein